MAINDSANDNAKESFTFVVIPASDDAPLRQVRKSTTGKGPDDELLKYVNGYFGFSHHDPDNPLEAAELDYPRPDNNYTFVTMYSERNDTHLPINKTANKRATNLASACFTFAHLIYGDAIVGRYYDTTRTTKNRNRSFW